MNSGDLIKKCQVKLARRRSRKRDPTQEAKEMVKAPTRADVISRSLYSFRVEWLARLPESHRYLHAHAWVGVEAENDGFGRFKDTFDVQSIVKY